MTDYNFSLSNFTSQFSNESRKYLKHVRFFKMARILGPPAFSPKEGRARTNRPIRFWAGRGRDGVLSQILHYYFYSTIVQLILQVW